MKFLREPLFHFLLLGALIFLLFDLVNKGENEQPGKIVITEGKIQHIASTFVRTWQRPPSEEELEGLINDYIREEVLYREAVSMGLDEDDTVIRRRLRQKMEFISEDIASQVEPSDEELLEYLRENPDKFKTDTSFDFSQIYFNPENHDDSLLNDIQNLILTLNDPKEIRDISEIGDRILLESEYRSVSLNEIKSLFGENFSEELNTLEQGKWQGPVESGYGLHILFISERTEGRVPSLDEIRNIVKRELENERRLGANETFYQNLLERYDIIVEQPEGFGNEAGMDKGN